MPPIYYPNFVFKNKNHKKTAVFHSSFIFSIIERIFLLKIFNGFINCIDLFIDACCILRILSQKFHFFI